jgi:hypothetical protein
MKRQPPIEKAVKQALLRLIARGDEEKAAAFARMLARHQGRKVANV